MARRETSQEHALPTNETITSDQTTGFENLSRTDGFLASTISKPRWPVYAATLIAVFIAWFWIVAMSKASVGSGWESWAGEGSLIAILIALCTPNTATASVIEVYSASVAMWFIMSIAMMLPSAAPLMRTYADIADVAAGQGKKVVSIGYLLAGYLVLWLAFSLAAAALQTVLMLADAAWSPLQPLGGLIAGIILLGAGGYQFSQLRHACLEKCRNPFATLFGQWTTERQGVFRIGMEQGLFCVGCCWALMLVMLVVGTMNLAWMAFFTLFAVAEKSGSGKVTSYVSGGIMLVWGAGLLVLSAINF
ncbi:DUF2182 domain-containing protein [Ahrensia sp. R2A130]|uniref:DUF2182 domain-containing protein n=1 Tax=Ahrensia sp. R2A130 TaxID=744979 RepID=UPI0001E0D812|nr:DUF2182 domain-containing protein [Ahrensia sp. R2A130]EFL90338.1 putative metal-binding integral membrane protein [Ahrensia sp. R2A130]